MPSPSPKARRTPRIRKIRRALKALLFVAIAIWLGSCLVGLGVSVPTIAGVQHHVETGPGIIVSTGIAVRTPWEAEDWRVVVQGNAPHRPRYWWFLPPRNANSWSLPLWIPVLPIAIAWILARRFDLVCKGNICRSCGYDMQGLPNQTRFCPECGATIESSTPLVVTKAPSSSRVPNWTPFFRAATWIATLALFAGMVLTHNRTYLWSSAGWVQWDHNEKFEHRLEFIAASGGLALWNDVRRSSSEQSWHYDSADFNRWAVKFPWMGWRWPSFMWDSSGQWGWQVRIPFWSLLLALWALPTWSLLRSLLRRPGRCVYCRFDLRPLPPRQAITCPYCYRTNFRRLAAPSPAAPAHP